MGGMMIGMHCRIMSQILTLLHALALVVFLMQICPKMQKTTVAHWARL